MTGHRQSFLSRITPLLDLTLAFFFAYFSAGITNRMAPLFGWERETAFNLITTTPFLAGAALFSIPFVLQLVGFYHRNSLQQITTALHQLVTFAAYYFVALYIYQSLSSGSVYFNHVLLVNAIGIPCVLFVRFLITRFWNLHTRRGRRELRQVILAGSEEDILRQWNNLPTYWKNRFNVVGRAIPGITTEAELQKMVEENSVSHLVVCGGLRTYHLTEYIINVCEMQGIDIYLMLNAAYHPGSMSAEINEVHDSRMLILSSRPTQFWARLIKDILDRIIATIILICSLPLWVFAAIGIKISDPKGKIFYRQQRSGLYGKPFGMWKFRSMYSDAEQRLAEVKAKYGNEMNGPIFKLTNDPRIFPFGHLIRKLSIDELPQLLNIIAGDMSIVGPRPLPLYETAEFPSIAHRRRLSVKPGLTCYWQIEDRSDNGDFDNMINKDFKYIDNWSLWLDVVLFFPEIPHNTGAAGRLAVATNSRLHLIKPLGFSLDEKHVRRTGLDYWPHVDLHLWDSLDELEAAAAPGARFWYLSTKARQGIWDASIPLQDGDYLVFGPESKGLPERWIDAHPDTALRIPMPGEHARSLNLSTAVAIMLYEGLRRTLPATRL